MKGELEEALKQRRTVSQTSGETSKRDSSHSACSKGYRGLSGDEHKLTIDLVHLFKSNVVQKKPVQILVL